ncbi:MAG: TonB-dependent receptor, partial [Betaproteobacteria bacterium]|nr:TonB-dependent receptor [Betaproteobacteria bacterium]
MGTAHAAHKWAHALDQDVDQKTECLVGARPRAHPLGQGHQRWPADRPVGHRGARCRGDHRDLHPRSRAAVGRPCLHRCDRWPGVAVSVTNGEGHTTAIRQPFTTAPLYLFLEDGIPTRAAGFFNHNALYEVNVPDAAAIEVVRGPGSALYGSDAIGGVVNVVTRAARSSGTGPWGAGATAEWGSFGWQRVLAEGLWTGKAAGGDNGVRVSLNRTQTDGWRNATAYERTSLGLRWDHAAGGGLRVKTIVNSTDIDQQTGANTPLPLADYMANPTRNNFAIAFRQVQALRASSEFEWDSGRTLWSVTPYARLNGMKLNGSFNLSADPRIEDTPVRSIGLLAKVRHDVDGPWKPRLILGMDLDRSSGDRVEDALQVTRSG